MQKRDRRRDVLRWAALLLIAVATGSCSKRLDRYTRSFDRVTIRAVNIVDLDGGTVMERRNVLIQNGKIRSISATSAEMPVGPTIDADGKFLLPGLADMHVHHYGGDYRDNDLFLYLANGVTTVRDMTGSQRDLQAKRDTGSGRLIGPRYYSCGPHLNASVKTVAEARAAVQEIRRELAAITGEKPIAGDEFRSIMRNEILSLPGRFATMSAVEDALVETIVHGYPADHFARYAERLRTLSETDLAAAAKTYIRPEDMIWIIRGDGKTLEASIREVGVGDVQRVDTAGQPVHEARPAKP